MAIKAKNCENCKHSEADLWNRVDGYYHGLTCRKGHKIRFYKPKSPTDENWGFKRKCEDFEAG